MGKFVNNFIKNNSVDYWLFWISIICFILSLFMPSIKSSGTEIRGILPFVAGWAMIWDGNFAWTANILIIYSLFAAERYTKASIFVSIAAFLLALTSLTVDKIPKSSIFSMGYDNLDQFLIGFYFWIASFPLLAISSYLKLRKLNPVK